MRQTFRESVVKIIFQEYTYIQEVDTDGHAEIEKKFDTPRTSDPDRRVTTASDYRSAGLEMLV
jgi:hypothetical protein